MLHCALCWRTSMLISYVCKFFSLCDSLRVLNHSHIWCIRKQMKSCRSCFHAMLPLRLVEMIQNCIILRLSWDSGVPLFNIHAKYWHSGGASTDSLIHKNNNNNQKKHLNAIFIEFTFRNTYALVSKNERQGKIDMLSNTFFQNITVISPSDF